jgi:AraC family transcriptional regulator, melibiose operon regulatory protein
MKKMETVQEDALFGWWSNQGAPALMPSAHRHNELELNFMERGEITYLFPGRRIELQAGQLFFFWSAVPHQLVGKSLNAYIHWMTVPLSWLVQRHLPERLLHALLAGAPLSEQGSPSEQAADLSAFQRWHAYLAGAEEEGRAILALEVEARLRRLVLRSPADSLGGAKPAASANPPAGKAEQIAHYLAEHFSEEWAVGEAARAAGLHPNYAMALFRRAYGLSMVAYVTQLRVAMAQQLLVSSDLDVLQVGYESGFGSTSRFYAAFKAQTGQTPLAYRNSLQWSGG